MHANDMAYEFAVSAPEDKFDGYASIFFTMLKSFKLIDISENNANAPKIETAKPAYKSATTYQFVKSLGSKGDGEGELDYPGAIAVDSLGNLYVADNGNQRIQKFDSDGKYITQWEIKGSTPAGISVDFKGNVYLPDTYNHCIQKFDSNGNFITKWGSKGTGEGQFMVPRGIAVHSSGNVYVAYSENYRIQQFVATN